MSLNEEHKTLGSTLMLPRNSQKGRRFLQRFWSQKLQNMFLETSGVIQECTIQQFRYKEWVLLFLQNLRGIHKILRFFCNLLGNRLKTEAYTKGYRSLQELHKTRGRILMLKQSETVKGFTELLKEVETGEKNIL